MTDQDAKNTLLDLLGLPRGASDVAIAVNVIARTMEGADADAMEAEARRLLDANPIPVQDYRALAMHAASGLAGITETDEAVARQMGNSLASLQRYGRKVS